MAENSNKTLLIILGIVGGVVVLGCVVCGVGGYLAYNVTSKGVRDAADRQQRLNELKQVGLAILSYHDSHKRGPSNAEDLAPYLEHGPLVARIRNKEIEVVWDAARIQQQKQSPTFIIMAWDTKLDVSGKRLVVYMDGRVAAVTETMFQAAPKPDPK